MQMWKLAGPRRGRSGYTGAGAVIAEEASRLGATVLKQSFLSVRDYPEQIFIVIDADDHLVAPLEERGWHKGPLTKEVIARLTIGPDWSQVLVSPNAL